MFGDIILTVLKIKNVDRAQRNIKRFKVIPESVTSCLKSSPYHLSPDAGLAFIGKYLKSTDLKSLLDAAFPIRAGIVNSDVLKSHIALLSLQPAHDGFETLHHSVCHHQLTHAQRAQGQSTPCASSSRRGT
jgi:hypothetical protein